MESMFAAALVLAAMTAVSCEDEDSGIAPAIYMIFSVFGLVIGILF